MRSTVATHINKPSPSQYNGKHLVFFISALLSLYFISVATVRATSVQNEQSLPFTLAGTITGSQPLALLKFSDKKLHFYTLADKIENYTITAIEQNKITLSYNKQLYALHLQQRTALVSLPVSVLKAASEQPANLPVNIQIKRELLNHIRHNIQQWLSAISFKLEITDGRVSGYTIESIQNIPLNNAIGLQQGDIIKSINGISVAQPRLFAETTNNLINSSDIYIKIERGHKLNTLHFRIKD